MVLCNWMRHRMCLSLKYIRKIIYVTETYSQFQLPLFSVNIDLWLENPAASRIRISEKNSRPRFCSGTLFLSLLNPFYLWEWSLWKNYGDYAIESDTPISPTGNDVTSRENDLLGAMCWGFPSIRICKFLRISQSIIYHLQPITSPYLTAVIYKCL